MFDLLFGFFWTSLSLIVFIATMHSESSRDDVLAYIVILVFIVIGLYVFIKGLKKVVQNYLTDKKGEDFYGFIKSVSPDGNYVNGTPEYKADVLVYVVSTGNVETISEIVGFKPSKYPGNSYVKGKYYNGDINITEKIDDLTKLPLNVQNYFNGIDFGENNSDVIEVDGVKYQKIDENK